MIIIAIPFFFLGILLERWVERRRGRAVYRLNDSINDVATGMLQLLLSTAYGVALAAIYIGVWQHWRCFDMPETWWNWVLLFFLVDLCYYWFHRMSHEMNAPWAAHSVHHQSEEYNLSVALRQGAFQGLFSWVFYIPLAVLGFPWFMTFTHKGINTLYQFWIHTRLIGKMGPLEWVFNTPSHHRVHHGRNPQYLDKNHAGVLIIWDRLFGTFTEEQEEPIYGVTKPLASWNPLWANLQGWVDLWHLAWRAPRWRDKLLVWVKPPGWRPAGLGAGPQGLALDAAKYDVATPPVLGRYILVHMAISVGSLTALLATLAQLDRATVVWPGAALVTLSLLCFGGLTEGRRWVPLLEFMRLLATTVWLIWLTAASWWVIAVGFLGLVTVLVWLCVLATCRGHFLVPMQPRGLDVAEAEFEDWRALQSGRAMLPTVDGEAGAAIFSQRWGGPR